MTPTNPVDEFVDRQRAQRAERGQPPTITDEAIYRVLDGLLAAKKGGRHEAA